MKKAILTQMCGAVMLLAFFLFAITPNGIMDGQISDGWGFTLMLVFLGVFMLAAWILKKIERSEG